ncbi:MAG: hypothetical protein M3P93_14530 [Actinomycetota bacterium]|nr:hypothetical protein [Actinomycetota bacterium]
MSVASQVAAVLEQRLDGDQVLVGSSRECLGFDGAVGPEAVTRAKFDRAAAYLPALRDLPVTRSEPTHRPVRPRRSRRWRRKGLHSAR